MPVAENVNFNGDLSNGNCLCIIVEGPGETLDAVEKCKTCNCS